jgi:hypothetical protein
MVCDPHHCGTCASLRLNNFFIAGVLFTYIYSKYG